VLRCARHCFLHLVWTTDASITARSRNEPNPRLARARHLGDWYDSAPWMRR
jgi:hypothetical protein